jgi:hypothetical protein
MGQWSPETPLAELFYTYLLNCLFNWWTQMQQILTSPWPTGGGDATPADSGAYASVRLAGRTSSTQLAYRDIYLVDMDFFKVITKSLLKYFFSEISCALFYTMVS